MPNKKNPDPAELVRGRAARVIGALTGSLTLLKGLPLAYQRDLQEDKAPLFDAVAVLRGVARRPGRAARRRWRSTATGCATAADEGYTTATAVADALVRRGVPFRAAHHVVGSLVAQAEEAGVGLDAVPDAMIGLALGASGDPTAADAGRGARHRRRAPRRGLDRRRARVLRRHRRHGARPRPAALARRARASTRLAAGDDRASPTSATPASARHRRSGAVPSIDSNPRDCHAGSRDHRSRAEGAPPRPPRRRPAAGDVIDLAAEYGYDGLPTTDVRTSWRPGSAAAPTASALELYLETFAHTVGVMQERDAIVRVAAECAEDLAADGVVYAEVRYAPELSTERGLTLDEVVEANLEGFRSARERAAEAGRPIVMKMLVTAMRQVARSVEVAECAVRWRDAGVVGFDVAGPEKGYPPTRYLDAFDYIRRENFHITIHAGESFGLPSIWEALQFCGAERLGHGVRIVDDITTLPRRLGRARAAGGLRPRPAGPARDVPDLERPHRRRGVDRRAPDRPAPPAALPGHGQHRQPADERRDRCRASSRRSTRRSGSASARWSG